MPPATARGPAGRDLVAGRVDAHGGGGDLVLAERAEGAAPAGELDAPGHEAHERREPEDPEGAGVERDALVVGAGVAVLPAERRQRRVERVEDAADGADAGPRLAGRLARADARRRDEKAHDLGEAQRDDGEVSPLSRRLEPDENRRPHDGRRGASAAPGTTKDRAKSAPAAAGEAWVRGDDNSRSRARKPRVPRRLARHAVDDVQRGATTTLRREHEQLPDRAVRRTAGREIERQPPARPQRPARRARPRDARENGGGLVVRARPGFYLSSLAVRLIPASFRRERPARASLALARPTRGAAAGARGGGAAAAGDTARRARRGGGAAG